MRSISVGSVCTAPRGAGAAPCASATPETRSPPRRVTGRAEVSDYERGDRAETGKEYPSRDLVSSLDRAVERWPDGYRIAAHDGLTYCGTVLELRRTFLAFGPDDCLLGRFKRRAEAQAAVWEARP